MMNNEEWMVIDKFENYAVSTNGDVKNIKTGRVLKGRPDKDGYLRVSLYTDGVCYEQYIHRLVAEAFIPNPENKPTVDHIDRNRKNNLYSNLCWATHKEQTLNSLINKRKRAVVAIKDSVTLVFDSRNECATKLNLNRGAVLTCLKGKSKTHKGYTFRYLESSDTINE